MTPQTKRLRQRQWTLGACPAISAELAVLVTQFYRESEGRHTAPVMRALCIQHLCRQKTLHYDAEELIVGERGPAPKVAPTFPELTCHSLDDLRILDSRPKTSYTVDQACLEAYTPTVIPYLHGRSLRHRIFAELPADWKNAYESGIFTEFMEQRAPGHTVLDDKIYGKGMRDFQADIDGTIAALD